MRRRAAALLPLLRAVAARLGPGAGPWQTATPESQGLSAHELAEAAAAVDRTVPNRVCYIVVKNGYIVHETYYSGWTEASTRAGYSTTKSSCSALYGIATEQGWADPYDRVADRNSGVRTCNADAEFRHVLTMTGESADIAHPRFRYASGCLNSLVDFFGENNPDGLSMEAWKDRHWQPVLGMEHMSWTNPQCGSGQVISCRDLARSGQLFLNDGHWPGAGQLMSRQHAVDSRRYIFPHSEVDRGGYGYTLWLHLDDPVDPHVSTMSGANAQCVHISKEHEALVVSMGNGQTCLTDTWFQSRHAIVSRDHPHYNATRPSAVSPQQRATEAALRASEAAAGPDRAEVTAIRDAYANRSTELPEDELRAFNALLRKWGEPTIH